MIDRTRGPYKLMPSGKLAYLANPIIADIDPFDIAHCLARIPRFTGAQNECISVAQHCVHVSMLVPVNRAEWGLLHDAHEAYIGDAASPLKRLLGDVYARLDHAWKLAVRLRFGVCHCDVRYWDIVSMLTERRDHGPYGLTDAEFLSVESADQYVLDPSPVVPLSPAEAEEAWLARFCELGIRG